MTLLAAWAAIVQAPVIGAVGHRLTYPAGPAHPTGQHPAWVVPGKGCDLVKLHRAHCATVVNERHSEASECQTSPARVTPRRQVRAKANVLRMARRSA